MSSAQRSNTAWLQWLSIGAASCAILWLERRRPLRAPKEPQIPRQLRNLTLAALSSAVIRWCERPIVDPLTQRVERKRQGLIQLLPSGATTRDVIAVLAMDYTLYVWHVLSHRVPLLYRLHRVHHADHELDASTAPRFHFLEMLASVFWRAAQVRLLGTSPRALGWWRRLTTASIFFHHANVRLPTAFERALTAIIMTPRLHTIHHSCEPEEQDANWSSGLIVWDRLHGTLRTTARAPIHLGVRGERTPQSPSLTESLAMPLARISQRDRERWVSIGLARADQD